MLAVGGAGQGVQVRIGLGGGVELDALDDVAELAARAQRELRAGRAAHGAAGVGRALAAVDSEAVVVGRPAECAAVGGAVG